MKLTPIREINTNSIYFTRSRNYPIYVVSKSRYGHSCNVPMVTYQMVCDTIDAKAGQLFTLEESIILSKFQECSDRDYHIVDFLSIPTVLNFYKEVDEDKLQDLADSIEIFEKQKLGMWPINTDQALYISKVTDTQPTRWCSSKIPGIPLCQS